MRAEQLSAKAHYRWDRNQHKEASEYFFLAAEAAELEFSKGESLKNQKMNHLARAATTLFKAGFIQESLPYFIEVCEYDWVGNDLKEDLHMVEWGFYYRLLSVKEDSPAFELLFQAARENCAKVGLGRFPCIFPFQESLLKISIELELYTIAKIITENIQNRKPISKLLRAYLKSIAPLLN